MSKTIRNFIAPLLILGVIYFPSTVTAATCEATSFENLKALLADVTKCPDPAASDHFYVELRLNSYIDGELDIPANTTLRGNLISDPGKAATLESHFKQNKPTPPDCLVTLNDGAAMDNIHLTKVYAKAAVCVKNSTLTTNVAIQGPNLDMSTELQNGFVGVSFMGSNNTLGGVVFSLNKGMQTFLPAGFNNNITLAEAPAPKPQDQPQAAQVPAATDGASESSVPKPPAPPSSTDVNTVILKNPDTGESVLVPMLPRMSPEMASPVDSESSCSLVPDRQAAASLVPIGMVMLIAGVTVIAAYRFRLEAQRMRKKTKE